MKRTALKRKTPLRAKKRINPMSARAKAEMKVWHKVKLERIQLLLDKFGYIPCEYCKRPIQDGSEIYCLEGHHNNHNRRENTVANCRITHRFCNQQIELLHVKDVPSMI